MYLLGMAVGGFIPIVLLAVLWDKFCFGRFMDDPIEAKYASVAAAYVVACILAGFGMADGEGFTGRPIFIYLLPTLALAMLVAARAQAIRDRIEREAVSIADTFH